MTKSQRRNLKIRSKPRAAKIEPPAAATSWLVRTRMGFAVAGLLVAIGLLYWSTNYNRVEQPIHSVQPPTAPVDSLAQLTIDELERLLKLPETPAQANETTSKIDVEAWTTRIDTALRELELNLTNDAQAQHLYLLLFVLVAIVGCDTADGPQTVNASGVVTLDVAPMEKAQVIFISDAGTNPASAMTDAQGKFSLSYNGEKKVLSRAITKCRSARRCSRAKAVAVPRSS